MLSATQGVSRRPGQVVLHGLIHTAVSPPQKETTRSPKMPWYLDLGLAHFWWTLPARLPCAVSLNKSHSGTRTHSGGEITARLPHISAYVVFLRLLDVTRYDT